MRSLKKTVLFLLFFYFQNALSWTYCESGCPLDTKIYKGVKNYYVGNSYDNFTFTKTSQKRDAR